MEAGQKVLLTCLALVAACTAPPPAGDVQGRGLRPLPWDLHALLPASAIPAPPSALPAFAADRAELPGHRSYSIGTPSRGYLIRGARLPVGEGPLRARPISLRRGAVHGTEELVLSLERAAERVAERWPGSVLWAGDLSAATGGDLPGHASHASGRDADLAFYLRDAAGRAADGPELPRVDGGGRAPDQRQFDVARNWALVAALLRDPRIQVQWLFVAHHIEALLLAEAERGGEDPELVQRAATVLRQPRDSSPHAEHFHLRLYCALEERVEGCLDTGPTHPWVDRFEAALAERVAEVLPFLRGAAPDEIRYAVTRVVRLRVAAAAPHVEPLIAHPDPDISALARDAVAFLRGERTPPEWAHLGYEEAGD